MHRIFIDRDRVQQVKAAWAAKRPVDIPLFKIKRATGLVRASSFIIKDAAGNVMARGMTDPSGQVCGATVWVEVPDGVTVEIL